MSNFGPELAGGPRRSDIRRGWSLACLGLVLTCGHLVTGVAVADEVRVRAISAMTGKPVQVVDGVLEFRQGEELRFRPQVVSSNQNARST